MDGGSTGPWGLAAVVARVVLGALVGALARGAAVVVRRERRRDPLAEAARVLELRQRELDLRARAAGVELLEGVVRRAKSEK